MKKNCELLFITQTKHFPHSGVRTSNKKVLNSVSRSSNIYRSEHTLSRHLQLNKYIEKQYFEVRNNLHESVVIISYKMEGVGENDCKQIFTPAHSQINEQSSYSAMLNIGESIPGILELGQTGIPESDGIPELVETRIGRNSVRFRNCNF